MDESDTATADEASNQPSHTPELQNTGAQNRIVAKMDAVGQLDGGQQSESDDARPRPAQPEHAAASASSSESASDLRASVADTLSSSAGAASNATGSSNPPITPHNSTVEDVVGKQSADAIGGDEHHDDDDDDDDDDVLHDIPVHHNSSEYPDEDIDRMMGLDSPIANTNGSTSRRTGRQTFDIEMAGDDDAEYGESSKDRHSHSRAVCCLSKYCCPCLPPCYKIGNVTVIIPSLYERTNRFGVVGPHWPGLVFTFGLLWSASYYYTNHAFTLIGPISGGICLAMTAVCTVLLCAVAFSDPGMITPEGQERANGNGVGGKYAGLPTDGRDLSDWRYCDLCSVYQPPTAAHCPDCNLCIDGYDHHCPWMGQCIGKRNMKAFVSFNLSWMFFLFYAIAWVSFGPMVSSNTAWHGYAGNTTDGGGSGDSGHNVTGNHSVLI